MAIVTHTRHGTFAYPDGIRCWTGRLLSAYGEYSEDEVNVLRQCLRPGDVAINVGANIGAFVLPMANLVGPTGHIYAYEPHPETATYLRRNVLANNLQNVTVLEQAAGATAGKLRMKSYAQMIKDELEVGGAVVGDEGEHEVEVATIDELNLDKLRFVIMDAEGSELDALKGTSDTIARLRPMLYMECDKEGKVAPLIDYLADTLHYRMYWHRPPYYNPDNFRGEKSKQWVGNTISQNIFCAPEESGIGVAGWDEVGNIQLDERIVDREIERFGRIAKHYPDDPMVRLILAHNLNMARRGAEAQAQIDRNLADDPGHVPSLAIKSMIDLQRGNWREGFQGYELRYENKKKANAFGDRPHDGEKWDGTPTDETVLIWGEQGYGDLIMFGRFIERARQRAPNLVVEVQSALHELFETSGIPANGALRRMGRALPKYKYHCSIPSLPAALGVATDDDIRCPPYLRCDPALLRIWQERERPMIGWCGEGSPRSERAYTRNIDDKLMLEVKGEFGGPWLSLVQQGQFDGFADTAACIMSLDLVITVDTAVAHLAGALGKETWLLLSFEADWRWGLNGDRTPWYNSMRIFRQSRMMDWPSVVEQVHAALIERRDRRQEEAA